YWPMRFHAVPSWLRYTFTAPPPVTSQLMRTWPDSMLWLATDASTGTTPWSTVMLKQHVITHAPSCDTVMQARTTSSLAALSGTGKSALKFVDPSAAADTVPVAG